MTCGIYAIVGPEGRMYVGSSTNIETRFASHGRALRRGERRYSRKFLSDWRKHGREAFSLKIIEECDEALLAEREDFHLRNLRPAYNVDHEVSGAAGCRRSAEARQRMSEAAKRRWAKPFERAAQSQRLAGHKQSLQTIEKRCLKLRGQKRTPEQRENIVRAPRSPRPLGIKPSPSTLAKLRAYGRREDVREARRQAALQMWARRKGAVPHV